MAEVFSVEDIDNNPNDNYNFYVGRVAFSQQLFTICNSTGRDNVNTRYTAATKKLIASLCDCPSLTSLELGYCELGSELAVTLATALQCCQNLSYFSVRGNAIGTTGIQALMAELPYQCRNLSVLDVSSNCLAAEGAWAVAEGLKECKELTDLDIGCNNISDEGIMVLATAIQTCPKLLRLDIRNNNIKGEGLRQLATVLPSCPMLTELNISFNEHIENGIDTLTRELPQCSYFTKLGVSGIDFSPSTLQKLLDTMKRCPNTKAHLSWVM